MKYFIFSIGFPISNSESIIGDIPWMDGVSGTPSLLLSVSAAGFRFILLLLLLLLLIYTRMMMMDK